MKTQTIDIPHVYRPPKPQTRQVQRLPETPRHRGYGIRYWRARWALP